MVLYANFYLMVALIIILVSTDFCNMVFTVSSTTTFVIYKITQSREFYNETLNITFFLASQYWQSQKLLREL